MADTTLDNNPQLSHRGLDLDKAGRKYGIILGILTAVYLLLVNLFMDPLPLSVRFAKYLLIIPVVWYAVKAYADSVPDGEAFKGEIGLVFRIGMWAVIVLATLNIMLSSFSPELGFEQFLNEGDTFGDMMVNSFFVAMETLVMTVIVGFVFMQYYKGGGTTEDQ